MVIGLANRTVHRLPLHPMRRGGEWFEASVSIDGACAG
jgi:hypothetical protein